MAPVDCIKTEAEGAALPNCEGGWNHLTYQCSQSNAPEAESKFSVVNKANYIACKRGNLCAGL